MGLPRVVEESRVASSLPTRTHSAEQRALPATASPTVGCELPRHGEFRRIATASRWSARRPRFMTSTAQTTSKPFTIPRSSACRMMPLAHPRRGVRPFRPETVQNLGVVTPRAETDGGPTVPRQHDPAQASRWRSRSEPSASDERLVVTSACAAVRSFAGATATARYFP